MADPQTAIALGSQGLNAAGLANNALNLGLNPTLTSIPASGLSGPLNLGPLNYAAGALQLGQTLASNQPDAQKALNAAGAVGGMFVPPPYNFFTGGVTALLNHLLFPTNTPYLNARRDDAQAMQEVGPALLRAVMGAKTQDELVKAVQGFKQGNLSLQETAPGQFAVVGHHFDPNKLGDFNQNISNFIGGHADVLAKAAAGDPAAQQQLAQRIAHAGELNQGATLAQQFQQALQSPDAYDELGNFRQNPALDAILQQIAGASPAASAEARRMAGPNYAQVAQRFPQQEAAPLASSAGAVPVPGLTVPYGNDNPAAIEIPQPPQQTQASPTVQPNRNSIANPGVGTSWLSRTPQGLAWNTRQASDVISSSLMPQGFNPYNQANFANAGDQNYFAQQYQALGGLPNQFLTPRVQAPGVPSQSFGMSNGQPTWNGQNLGAGFDPYDPRNFANAADQRYFQGQMSPDAIGTLGLQHIQNTVGAMTGPAMPLGGGAPLGATTTSATPPIGSAGNISVNPLTGQRTVPTPQAGTGVALNTPGVGIGIGGAGQAGLSGVSY